jgi:hypothetical protein
MPSNVVAAARKAGVTVHQYESLEEVLAETDVLYVTRVQKERFNSDLEWQKVKDAYRVDHGVLSRAKEEMIVMHPLPRVNGKRGTYCSRCSLMLFLLQKSTQRLTLTLDGPSTSGRCAMGFSCVYALPLFYSSAYLVQSQIRMALLTSVMG